MPKTAPTYLINQIQSVIRSTGAARTLKDHQARILAFRIARLMDDELAMMHEDAAME